MSYGTLLVHLELGCSNQGVLQVAKDLVRLYGSRVVGTDAGRPDRPYQGGVRPDELIPRDLREIETEMLAVERDFRAALECPGAIVEWRPSRSDGRLAPSLICEARCADLVVMGVAVAEPVVRTWRADVGDVVLGAGRPVLVVPSDVDRLNTAKVLVLWKDAREARLAISDALPFLRRATHIDVVELVAEDDLGASRSRLRDVVDWLGHHGVAAVASSSCGDPIVGLHALMDEIDPGVVVAGAYGHSRVREWAWGGVSRDLLVRPDRCTLLSN